VHTTTITTLLCIAAAIVQAARQAMADRRRTLQRDRFKAQLQQFEARAAQPPGPTSSSPVLRLGPNSKLLMGGGGGVHLRQGPTSNAVLSPSKSRKMVRA
jgi:hypothetical protein